MEAMEKSTHTPEYAALKATLVSIRGTAKLTQRQLASLLGVSHSWVAKVESGERRIDLIEFAWFCRACGTDPLEGATPVLSKSKRGYAQRAPRKASGNHTYFSGARK